MRYFAFLFHIKSSKFSLYLHLLPFSFGLATFQVLGSHLWLMATLLYRACLESEQILSIWMDGQIKGDIYLP